MHGIFTAYSLSLAASVGFLAAGAWGQDWERLFDGTTLAGWTATGKGTWTIADGALTGAMAAGNPESYLISQRRAGDFAMRLKFQWIRGNSGVNFRNERKGELVLGIQSDLEGGNTSGWLYDNVKAAYVARNDSVKAWYKAGAWNDLWIEAIGEDISVSLNGKRTAAYRDAGGRKEGVFAFQLHAGQAMEVRFRDIEMKDLSATAVRPRAQAKGRQNPKRLPVRPDGRSRNSYKTKA